ncbi:MAG: flagellar basal body rod protein FlgB [Phycisphaerae bacterium]
MLKPPPSSMDFLQAGLRAASLRQAVIANNIANLDTPGFRRQTVDFEKALSKAIASGDVSSVLASEAQIVQPKSTPVDPTGNDVNLDMEVAELLKNSNAYKTYLRMTAKVYRQMELATQVE